MAEIPEEARQLMQVVGESCYQIAVLQERVSGAMTALREMDKAHSPPQATEGEAPNPNPA